MPTAGRLAAAVVFTALIWSVSQLIKPLFPEGTDTGAFAEVNAGLALVISWLFAGARAGRSGWSGAVSYGVTNVVAITFWALLLHSGAEMVRLSLRNRYDGPAEAVIAVFGLMWDHAQLMATLPVLGLLLLGGAVGGLITEWFGRRFR
jgi:hypothetical protein